LASLERRREGHRRDVLDQGAPAGLGLVQPCLGALPLRGVAHRADDQQAGVGLKRTEADLDGHLGPVLAPPEQLPARPHGPDVRVAGVTLAVGDVGGPEALRHQQFDRLAEQFLAAVAEQLLRLAVDDHDAAGSVGDHHGVRGGLDQADEEVVGAPRLGLLQLGHPFAQAADLVAQLFRGAVFGGRIHGGTIVPPAPSPTQGAAPVKLGGLGLFFRPVSVC
jgi:hypothetical protein